MGLFNDSIATHDAGRMGTGYGSLASNTNPAFSTALDKENELKRHLAASSALEHNVGTELENNDRAMFSLAGMGNQRNEFVAGMQNADSEAAYQRQLSQYMKQKQPGFWDRLGGSFADSVGHSLGSFGGTTAGGGSMSFGG